VDLLPADLDLEEMNKAMFGTPHPGAVVAKRFYGVFYQWENQRARTGCRNGNHFFCFAKMKG
jgi:hypothetical protein